MAEFKARHAQHGYYQWGQKLSMTTRPTGRCLTYCPLPHLGYGPAQTCVSILENGRRDLLENTLFVLAARKKIANSIAVEQGIPPLLRSLPYISKLGFSGLNESVAEFGVSRLNRIFSEAIDACDPENTIAYFWPDPPVSLVQHARSRGLLTVREMINTFRGSAKLILDEAYGRLGLKPAHNITAESAERERQELALYDYVFASNAMTEASLIAAGVDASHILPSSFGWSPERFEPRVEKHRSKDDVFRVLFVGSVCVRKGIPQLLAAWGKRKIKGTLILAGPVENSLQPLLQNSCRTNSVHVLNHTDDVGSLYQSADIFVFPTLEEGGPQVTYEAASFGLPIVTTKMGAGRLVRDGVNGIIVDPNDVAGLAASISRLAQSSELRHKLGRQAKSDTMNYTYQEIGHRRALLLSGLLADRALSNR